MLGAERGVAERMCDQNLRVLYTHCYGHTLNLAVADVMLALQFMGNALNCAYEIVKLVKNHLEDIPFVKI